MLNVENETLSNISHLFFSNTDFHGIIFECVHNLRFSVVKENFQQTELNRQGRLSRLL